jgi:peptidoglycan/LPS O-acetylase OafA/YrhL
LWTIQYELICYLVLPVLGIAGAMKRKWIGPTMLLLFYTIMQLQDYTGLFYFETHPGMWLLNINHVPRFFAYFFCGVCVYLYRGVIPRNIGLMLLSVAALALSALVLPVFNMVFPIAGTYLLFYIAYSSRIRVYDFAKRGDISYGVYLYAWPVQQMVLYCLHPHITLYQLFAISLLITVLTAYFWSWKCIEKPFMELKQYSNRRR